jgi:predicted amidohydrolase YtcJ
MTPAEMRRKGSWAVRFYGRSTLPPLVDAHGHPTRHALSAHAWGEPVPKTVAAARRIAAKGERLLAKYKRIRKQG